MMRAGWTYVLLTAVTGACTRLNTQGCAHMEYLGRYSSPGGVALEDARPLSEDACVEWCMSVGDLCTGVTFRLSDLQCLVRTEPGPQGQPNDCCVQYRKQAIPCSEWAGGGGSQQEEGAQDLEGKVRSRSAEDKDKTDRDQIGKHDWFREQLLEGAQTRGKILAEDGLSDRLLEEDRVRVESSAEEDHDKTGQRSNGEKDWFSEKVLGQMRDQQFNQDGLSGRSLEEEEQVKQESPGNEVQVTQRPLFSTVQSKLSTKSEEKDDKKEVSRSLELPDLSFDTLERPGSSNHLAGSKSHEQRSSAKGPRISSSSINNIPDNINDLDMTVRESDAKESDNTQMEGHYMFEDILYENYTKTGNEGTERNPDGDTNTIPHREYSEETTLPREVLTTMVTSNATTNSNSLKDNITTKPTVKPSNQSNPSNTTPTNLPTVAQAGKNNVISSTTTRSMVTLETKTETGTTFEMTSYRAMTSLSTMTSNTTLGGKLTDPVVPGTKPTISTLMTAMTSEPTSQAVTATETSSTSSTGVRSTTVRCEREATVMRPEDGVNQQGGLDLGRAVTSQECQAWCLSRPACLSVDYNLWDQSCWWHDLPGVVRNASCCTHYAKTKACVYDCFDVHHGYIINSTNETVSNTTSDTLSPPDTISNLTYPECRAACVHDDNCTAFTFSDVTATCDLRYDVIGDVTAGQRVDRNDSVYAVKRICYDYPDDTHITLTTTAAPPSIPEFTFPVLPSTPPYNIEKTRNSKTESDMLLSPASLIVLTGSCLVLLAGGATLVGFLYYRRREKRHLLTCDRLRGAGGLWVSDSPYTTRGLHYWYTDHPFPQYSSGGASINPAYTEDEFPVGRTAAEFGLGGADGGGAGRGRRPAERARSFSEVYLDHSPTSSSFPTFPLRPIRVAVPSPDVTSPSTHAHAHCGYTAYPPGHVIDGRRLPRFEMGPLQIGHVDDELRSAYP